jgi:phosphatidylglycerol lysyltransferase
MGIALLLAAGIILHRVLQGFSWDDVKSALARLSAADFAKAGAATALSYVALVGYDLLALREVGARVRLRTAAAAAFIGQSFTFTIGFGLLTGSAVRLRIYGLAGVAAEDIVAIGILCALTFWSGLLVLAAFALVTEPSVVTLIDGMQPWLNMAVGLALLAGLLGLVWVSQGERILQRGDWSFRLPRAPTIFGAIVIGSIDTAAAALALWFLLPQAGDLTFPAFLATFILATALGVISHVPGGVGVFDATILLASPGLPKADLAASLLAFRIIYYLVPFGLSVLLLTLRELGEHWQRVRGIARQFGDMARPFVPQASALVVFVGGTILLLSGALPSESPRMAYLRYVVPLPFVEASHLLASVVGLVLVALASGLARRLARAWRAAIALLAAGALFSLAKGLDYEEAAICLAGIGVLAAARGAFYRQAEIFATVPSIDWIMAGIAVIGASIWLGFFTYQHIEYNDQLWWEFAYHGDAPRFLRATLGTAVVAVGLAVYTLIHRRPRWAGHVTKGTLDMVRSIVTASPRAEAHLALLGDKQFLLSEARDGLIMYGVQGRSVIAMGDPIAQSSATAQDLVWCFRELADNLAATPVFYQVSTEYLSIYLDVGFALVKLGEEAWVDLSRFTLQGGEGRKLRQAQARALNAGTTFAIVPAGEIDTILLELREVSDLWLREKGQEKGFSLGFWSDAYLRCSDCAIIRHDGRIVAFANIWRSADRREFTIDLMRHRPDAPGGCMDLLFIGLMSQAKMEGYRWFNLGMTPLAGLPTHRLASWWSRIGGLIYRRADRFYNFEGVRAFKQKFRPEWRPRYLAYPGGLALPRVLLDVTTLIAASPRRAAGPDCLSPSEENSCCTSTP